MTFENQSDRDLLIETVTSLREMNRRLDREREERKLVDRDVEVRMRALERKAWLIWGAVIAAGGSGLELLHHIVLGGK